MKKILMINDIKSLIANNDISVAIKTLLENPLDEWDNNMPVMFSNRWRELTKQKQLGIISNSEFLEIRNKIVHDLLGFCEQEGRKQSTDAIQINSQKRNELISVLGFRARKINNFLKQYARSQAVRKYIVDFNSLHEEHINELKLGNYIAAHEILRQIHSLSMNLEIDKKGDKERIKSILGVVNSYLVDPMSEYKNGFIITTYLDSNTNSLGCYKGKYLKDNEMAFEYYLDITELK